MNFLAGLLALACAAVCAQEPAPDLMLFNFESKEMGLEQMDRVTLVPENATEGKTAGKVSLAQPWSPNFGFWGGANHGPKWAEHDQFIMDVVVEGGPVKVFGFIRDNTGPGWWERHNYELKLTPGKKRIAFSLGALTRQNGNGNLDLKNLEFFAMQFASEDPKQPATIYVDNGRLAKGAGSFEVKVLYSFEGGEAEKYLLEDWPEDFKGKSTMTAVEEHATHGKKALKLESRAPAGNIQFTGFEKNWSTYDSLAIDVYNPSDKPVMISGWVRGKDPNAGWWDRYNYERQIKPGFSSLRFATGSMTGPNGGKPIDTANVVKFNIAIDKATLYIDNVRLIRGSEEIPVAGMKKFDAGPANSGVMPGFTRLTREEYTKERGWGWMPGATFGRDFDMNEMLGRHRPPDDLCRDFMQPTQATLAIDLPNGDYGVWIMLGPPGNGWGETFTRRTVSANGKQVIEDSFDLASFTAHEFKMQDAEDLPGDDLWEKYIRPLFQGHRFDVTVTDGQLKLDFKGDVWGVMLNGLVVWPKTSDKDAERWLANLDVARKEQYQANHVEKLPEAPAPYPATDADKQRGYVAFIHSPDRDVQVNGVPTPDEAKRSTLDIGASPGEPKDMCFGLLPLKDCGILKTSVTPLTGPAGTITPDRISIQATRYKALNFTAVYTPLPKYLDKIPAEGIAIKPGVTRSFWYIVDVPADAKPGEYKGQLNLEFSGAPKQTYDVKVTVWPIKLVEPEFPMGMFMMNPAWASLRFDPEARWAAIKDMLQDARKHGLTSVDPGLNIALQRIENGKAIIDFTDADRYMKLAREAGFTQELNGYGVSPGINIRVGCDHNAEAKRWGMNSYAELVKAYFDAVREHAKANNWLPLAFCTDDEYLIHPGGNPDVIREHHKVLQENAPGFRFVTFDSAFYNIKKEDEPRHEQMLTVVDTWGAGVHSEREAEITKKNNRRLWLYNTGMNRFTFGTYMYFARTRHNVSGFFQWVYPNVGTYHPFYHASHNESHYGVVYPSTRGVRSTPTWERISAGCYDHRYFEAARRLITQARKDNKGVAQADALEKTIEATISKLNFGTSKKVDARSGEGKADNPYTPENMEAFRRNVAEGIVKLQEAMK